MPSTSPFAKKDLVDLLGHEFYIAVVWRDIPAANTSEYKEVIHDVACCTLIEIAQRKPGRVEGYNLGTIEGAFVGGQFGESGVTLPAGDYIFTLEELRFQAHASRLAHRDKIAYLTGTAAPYDPKENTAGGLLDRRVSLWLAKLGSRLETTIRMGSAEPRLT